MLIQCYFILTTFTGGRYCYHARFTDVRSRAQRGSVTCPKPHSQQPGQSTWRLWQNCSSLLPLGDKVGSLSNGDNSAGEVGAALLALMGEEMRTKQNPGWRVRGRGLRCECQGLLETAWKISGRGQAPPV